MAELTDTTTSDCCAPEQQASCCAPEQKADCRGHGGGCGCGAASEAEQASDIRDQVHERYAAAARAIAEQQSGAGCCGPVLSVTDADGEHVFGGALYGAGEASEPPRRPSPHHSAVGCQRPSRSSSRARPSSISDLVRAPTG